ncbi:GatB/YqeY domain-containing protein [Myriangium duriaei CBS 260.36]|uniref:Altered inheritance of mitochondria protein 41 n=1 Tax=Myriangium duriaei CBS 260.36 TaxID=1168546 RepID=A0A9P4MN16_9PEZI|nr:GatB/YqeY domain-containing protein [Myriangium duriaei CBS 260.36]
MQAIRPLRCIRGIPRPMYSTRWILSRFNSTASTPPALLSKLREDLKTSMRAKDANRLAVVRGLLNEVANAGKTSTPITSDLQLLGVVRKRIAAARTAKDEAAAAGRQDLADKEESQIKLLDEYAANVETWSDDKIGQVVTAAVEQMKAAGDKLGMGDVIKKLLAPGGDLDGKPVEKSKVSIAVKRALS